MIKTTAAQRANGKAVLGLFPMDAENSFYIDLISDIEELQAIVGNYPKTQDGVQILPEMKIWTISDSGEPVEHRVKFVNFGANSYGWCDYNDQRYYAPYFSTREAAEAAKEASSKDQNDD